MTFGGFLLVDAHVRASVRVGAFRARGRPSCCTLGDEKQMQIGGIGSRVSRALAVAMAPRCHGESPWGLRGVSGDEVTSR